MNTGAGYDNPYNAEQQPRRNGSREYYHLLEKAADIHDRKSHDYASNSNPFGNYLFAGGMSKLFDNPDDAGFMCRIAEKIYRLANMENSGKTPKNEAIEDTEEDIVVITTLWMAARRELRAKRYNQTEPAPEYTKDIPEEPQSDYVKHYVDERIREFDVYFTERLAKQQQEILSGVSKILAQRDEMIKQRRK